MAAAATFYIDTPDFENATTVFSDAALTTCAANGFYQIGDVVREQVDCVGGLGGRLLPAETCATCGSPPTNAPTLAPTAPPSTPTPTIVPPAALYYKVLSCPDGAGRSFKFTSFTPSTSSLSQRYLDAANNITYTYDNVAGINNPPAGSVDNTLQVVTSTFGCPPVPTVYNFYNAQECNNNTRIVVRTPSTTTLTSGQAVKVTDANSLCYEILNIAPTTTVFKDLFGTAFTNCATCDPPPAQPNAFKITQSGQPDNEVQQSTSNPRSKGDEVLTNINSNCWTLGDPVVSSTGNTITGDCPVPFVCSTYTIGANLGGNASVTYNICYDGSSATDTITAGSEITICARTDTFTITNGSLITTGSDPCTQPNPPVVAFDFYTATPCSGGTSIVVKRDGANLPTNSSVKINGGATCYKINGGSSSITSSNTVTSTFADCNTCDPIVSCFALQLTFSNTVCPSNNPSTVMADTNNFGTATILYPAFTSCLSTAVAPSGYYTGTDTSSNTKISRYWDGNTLGTATSCTAPTTVRATLTLIDNRIVGPAAGYTISGDQVGDIKTGTFGAFTPFVFSTTVQANTGYTFTVASNVVNFFGSLNTTNITGTTTITGTIQQNAATIVQLVERCGDRAAFYMATDVPRNSGGIVLLRSYNSQGSVFCGQVIGVRNVPANSAFISYVINGGCFDPRCT